MLKRTDSQSHGKILSVGTVIGGFEVGLTDGARIRDAKQPASLFKGICQTVPVVGGFDHGNVIEILTVRHKHFDEIVESVTDADPTAPDIFSDKLTGFVERISTHADDCVVTMQVDGNEILLRDRNICCKMHAQVSFLLAQKKWKFYETWLGYVASVAWPFFFGDFQQSANSQKVSMPRNSRPFPSLKSDMSFGDFVLNGVVEQK